MTRPDRIGFSGRYITSHINRIRFVPVDCVFFDCFRDSFRRDFPIVGQGFQCGECDVITVYFEKRRKLARVSERPKPSVPNTV